MLNTLCLARFLNPELFCQEADKLFRIADSLSRFRHIIIVGQKISNQNILIRFRRHTLQFQNDIFLH